jgi:hypothetical protein
MHLSPNCLAVIVTSKLAPVWLYSNAFIHDKFLDFAHYNSTLISISQRIGLA